MCPDAASRCHREGKSCPWPSDPGSLAACFPQKGSEGWELLLRRKTGRGVRGWQTPWAQPKQAGEVKTEDLAQREPLAFPSALAGNSGAWVKRPELGRIPFQTLHGRLC